MFAPGASGGSDVIGDEPARRVVINEMLADPANPSDAFVELYNHSGQAVNLSGYVLTDTATETDYTFGSGATIPAGGFVHRTRAQLGAAFHFTAAGGVIYLKNPAGTRVVDALRYTAQAQNTAYGRAPNGAPSFHELQTATPGAANSGLLIRDVVINEIMYHPITTSDDEYIELCNMGAAAVDLSGWRLAGDISFTFGTVNIPANQYVVVARNPASLLTPNRYPQLTSGNTVGPFAPNLPNNGGRIVLQNSAGVVMDEVTYADGGRWGQWADGGGSSLELIDPRSDNRLPSNWADSDETSKSAFATVQKSGALKDGYLAGLNSINALEAILLGPGECLLDNVEVRDPGNKHLLAEANRSFETGQGDWKVEGDHDLTSIEPAPPAGLGGADGSLQSSPIPSTARGDYLANRLSVSLILPGTAPDTSGDFTLRARGRWLCGHPEIVLRLRGNYLEANGKTKLTACFPASRNFGFPGAKNSVTAPIDPNVGPAVYDVRHEPVLPPAGCQVVVTARFRDPDGFVRVSPQSPESPLLKYRVDPHSTLTAARMEDDGTGGDAIAGDGLNSAVIPGQTAGTLVAFRIEATDSTSPPRASVTTRFPRARVLYPGDLEQRECLIRWADPPAPGALGTYRLWITQATFNRWSDSSGRSELHNGDLDGTLVYEADRAICNAGARFMGSAAHSSAFNTPTGADCGYALDIPADDPLLGSKSVGSEQHNGDGSFTAEPTAYWLQAELGVPSTHRRYAYCLVNGVRRGSVSEDCQAPDGEYLEGWFAGDPDGDLYKLEVWWNDWKLAVGNHEIEDNPGFHYLHATLEKFPPAGAADKRSRTRYRWNWLKRAVNNSANDYDRLFALTEVLHTAGPAEVYGAEVEQVVDVDEWVRAFAIPRIVNNDDMYSFFAGHNMYAYKPERGKWRMIPVDHDLVFNGSFSPALFEPYRDPVLPKFIHHPAFERALWRAIYDAVNGPLQSQQVDAVLDRKRNGLLANNVNPGDNGVYRTWIANRRTTLQTQLGSVSAAFGVTTASGSTTANPVTFEGMAPVQVPSLTVNDIAYPVTWTTRTTWRVAVPLMAAGRTDFVFKAFDALGAQVGSTVSRWVDYSGSYIPGAHPRLNEWMAKNSYTLPDTADGDYEDWIELYNPRSVALNVADYRLKKTPAGTEWTIPAGTILPPRGFLLVWADNETNPNGWVGPGGDLHANFKLADNDSVELYAPAGATSLQTADVGTAQSDVSRGLYPDGQGAAVSMSLPTPRVGNSAATPPAIDLRINEWMADNGGFNHDPADNDTDDWIEFYNAGASAIDLGGYSLTDDPTNPTKWVFPPSVIIGAGSYLLI
jgi:hypothetical protein